MPNVPFTKENGMKCVCSKCPVQMNSQCVKEKMEMMKEMMGSGKEGAMPDPADFPGLYCASGRTVCKDFDFKQMCICGTCPLWSGYKLFTGKPTVYYCRDGKSE